MHTLNDFFQRAIPKLRLMLLATIIICMHSIPAQSRHIHGQPYRLDLDKTVDLFQLKDATFRMAMERLAPLGICYGAEALEIEGPRTSISLEKASVSQILDSLVEGFKGYEWNVRNGIVYIRPQANRRQEGPLRYLDSEIKRFKSSGLDITQTIGLLNHEAKALGVNVVTTAGYTAETFKKAEDDIREDAKISISISTPSRLGDILDRIVQADPPGRWIAVPMKDGRLAIMGESSHEHKELSPEYKRTLEKRRRRIEEMKGKPGFIYIERKKPPKKERRTP